VVEHFIGNEEVTGSIPVKGLGYERSTGKASTD
jgi:hypothetical protein